MGEFPNKDTQFQPGQTGNPNGRPPGPSITTGLKKYLAQEIEITNPITKKAEKKQIRDVVALKLIAEAIKGNVKAIKEINDRLEGKPRQGLEVAAQVVQMPKITRNGKDVDFDIG